jgi:hypothetical protein
VNAAHQAASLAVEIGPHLFLKRCLIEVPATNGNTERDRLLFCFASDILVDSDRRVDAAAFAEKSPDGTTRAFRSYQDDIDVGWNLDFGQILEDGRETVREVKGLKVSLVIIALLWYRHVTFPLVNWGLIAGHVSLCAASLSRFMTMVPLEIASSISNRFVPGIQPSCCASFHEAPFLRTPMITFRPLSRRFRP